MRWLQRNAWWGLVFLALVFVIFGLADVASGAAADPGIPLGLTGMTLDELSADDPAAYRLFDFITRANGWGLAMLGLLMAAILLFAFRRDQRWAWWTMWALPIWSFGVFVFYLVAGTHPDQPPPPPMVSGPVVGALSALILLVSAPRFFGATSNRSSGGQRLLRSARQQRVDYRPNASPQRAERQPYRNP